MRVRHRGESFGLVVCFLGFTQGKTEMVVTKTKTVECSNRTVSYEVMELADAAKLVLAMAKEFAQWQPDISYHESLAMGTLESWILGQHELSPKQATLQWCPQCRLNHPVDAMISVDGVEICEDCCEMRMDEEG
jgi:hypothetical protein